MTDEQQKPKQLTEAERQEQEFKAKVLSLTKGPEEMPEGSTASNAKREMMVKTLKVFKVVEVGDFLTRTDIGKLIGFELPTGTWRRKFGEKIDNKNLIDFNWVKNRLRDDMELISEKAEKLQKGKSEYRFTLLRAVTPEDLE